jgi:hypothetical protein
VIPSTTLGLVVFLAALGPGYVYLRVAERRTARPERSGLVEAVELVVIGALASSLTLLVVVSIADTLNAIDVRSLSSAPRRYFDRHTLTVLWLLALALALAYVVAYVAARSMHRHRRPTIRPGGTSWQTAFDFGRPTKDHVVVVNLELRDHRLFAGILGGFTVDEQDNREIWLVAPLAVRKGPRAEAQVMVGDEFIIVRESDIVTVTGRYLPGKAETSRRQSSTEERPSAA